MEKRILPPYAPNLIESTRSVGYSFETALADIIDNSIGKGARVIDVFFQSIEEQYVSVIDDACGMNEDELESAMRYGSISSLDERPEDDLGRFGLGLKMASMSQCRRLTVITKKKGKLSAARWDLDYIIEQGDWATQWFSPDEVQDCTHFDILQKREHGTLVIWEKFDRLLSGSVDPQKVFDEKISFAQSHISLVFHRFLGDELPSKRVKIYFNNSQIDPADPFLISNPATQPMVEQILRIDGEQIKIKPYVLPFATKLTARDKKQLGEVADLRQNQGFYIYRNRRLIIWGTWFRLIKRYELNKLARVRVDIPNTLDSVWEIDIKKSTASLPDVIKKNLTSIVENTVGRSERVYKYRGRAANTDEMQHVWNTIENRGEIQYIINRGMPLYKKLETQLDEEGQSCLDSLIKMIEDALPYGDIYFRLAKSDNNLQVSILGFEEAYRIAVDMIEAVRNIGGDISDFLANMDKIDFFIKYSDVVKQVREEYEND